LNIKYPTRSRRRISTRKKNISSRGAKAKSTEEWNRKTKAKGRNARRMGERGLSLDPGAIKLAIISRPY